MTGCYFQFPRSEDALKIVSNVTSYLYFVSSFLKLLRKIHLYDS